VYPADHLVPFHVNILNIWCLMCDCMAWCMV